MLTGNQALEILALVEGIGLSACLVLGVFMMRFKDVLWATTALSTAIFFNSQGQSLAGEPGMQNGPYVGAQIGYQSSDYAFASAQDTAVDTGNTVRYSSRGYAVSGNFGYQYFFDRFYLAGEGGVSYTSTVVQPSGSSNDSIKWRERLAGQAYLRPGYKVDDKLLVFGLLGAEYADFKIDDLATISYSGSSQAWGLGVGLGVEYFIGKNLSVRGDFKHVTFEDVNYTINAPLTTHNRHLEPSKDVFSLGLSYHF